LQDPLRLQSSQSISENIAGYSQVALKLVEAAHPEERLAQHEKGPAVPQDIQGIPNRIMMQSS
jgi:hypothetical protein